jgi:peptidoglycan DL-endopeptidase CwlO
MKSKFRILLFLILSVAVPMNLGAAEGHKEGFFGKLKHFFVPTPAPTPTPEKRKRTRSRHRHKPTASPRPSATAKSETSPSASPSATPSPSASPEISMTPSPAPAETAESSASPGASAAEELVSPSVVPETPAPSPAPTTGEGLTTEESVSPSPGFTETPEVSTTPSASPEKNVTTESISTAEISGYDKYPPQVRKVLGIALDLTHRNLGYKYGSADPARGGMDCSGFIYYVLNKAGIDAVPRDAVGQYIWVRKAGKFQAVLGRSQETFELDALKPGDLLFWAGTYSVDRDPAITHTMIYLGREKATNQRIMVGASDGRTYKGRARFGVSVFDFKIAGHHASSEEKSEPMFVGYASIPGLSGN